MKYSLERTKTVQRWSWWKYRHDATMFNWMRFSSSFKTSSDKLQNVSQSVSVSTLETVCLTILSNVKLSPQSVHRNM